MTSSLQAGTFQPRKMPTQARARATVKRILEGARILLRDQGADAMTTRNVAATSGVRTGSIYQYFPNRDSILYALYGERMEETVEALEALMTRENLSLPLDEFLDLFNALLRDELQWGRADDVALDRAIGENPALRLAVDHVMQRLYSWLARLLRHYGCTWPEDRLMQFTEFLYSVNHFGFALRIRQEGEQQEFTRYLVNDLQRYLINMAVTQDAPELPPAA